MISSISAWSGSAYGPAAVSGQRLEQLKESFAALAFWQTSEEEKTQASVIGGFEQSLGADNNVRAAIIAGDLELDAKAEGARPAVQAANAPQGAGSSGSDLPTSVTYRSIVLADGTKLLQKISKFADGTTRTSASRAPSQDAANFRSALSSAVARAAQGTDEFISSTAA